jgi:hypothetical protein
MNKNKFNFGELGKSIISLIVFCSFWFIESNIESFNQAVIHLGLIVLSGYFFIKSMGNRNFY